MRVQAAVLAAALCISGCGSPRDSTPTRAAERSSGGRTALKEVATPDLSRAEGPLRERVEAAYSSLRARRDDSATSDADLGSAYGELGKLLMAAEFYDEAEPCLVNASTLAPSDVRWPYYLAHLYRLDNEPTKAVPLFEKVLRLEPSHVPALIWLGGSYVDQGRLDESVPLLQKALGAQPRSAAALFGLGRAELARHQNREAVEHFLAALAADPKALAVHYPLAMAYRALGDRRQTEAHLRLWKDVAVNPADPLMEEIAGLLKTSLDFAVRGTTALDRKNWTEAAMYFRKGLELSPRDPTLHLNLGTALFLGGDEQTALTHFEEAARLSPGYGRAHFALGVMLEGRGRDEDAIVQFSTAVKYDPGLVDSRFSLADALRRVGRPEASLEHYQALVRADPSASQARFGYAMALVRLKRYQEARAALEEGVKAHRDQAGFVHALARLLAAAPDDRVRDGQRALAIAQELRRTYSSIALNETLAMAQAEVGRFDQAAATQRIAIATARRENRSDLTAQLADNLALYERKIPCRNPWREDDPVHRPRAVSSLGR